MGRFGDTNRTLGGAQIHMPLMQRLFSLPRHPAQHPCKGHITVVGDQPGFLMFVR
jgi:hypothetical protein